MGITYTTVPKKWFGVVFIGILCFDIYEKTDAAFDCSSSDPNDCTCVTVIGPEETTVLSNTALSLQCNVSNTVGNEVQWIKGATPLGLDPTIPGVPRYSMNENYSLIINDVQLSDGGTYSCQVVDCLEQSSEAQVTVYVLPSNPEVADASDAGTLTVVASDETSLVCSTSHANPSATISWRNSSGDADLNSTSVETLDSDGESKSYTSTYTFTPTISDNSRGLYCAVGGEAVQLTGQATLNAFITLNVISKPSSFTLNGATSGGTLTIDAGSSNNVTCSATSTELDSTLNWERDGVEQPTASNTQENLDDGSVLLSSTLNIPGTGENSGVRYQCTVTIPGETRSYQESLTFTVNIYEFPLGWVIGGSVLGLLLIILIIILIICCTRRKDKETKLSGSIPDSSPPQMVITNPAIESEAEEPPPVVERVDVTTENALQQAASEFDYSSDTDTDHVAVDREADEDYESVILPDGDVFSLSSSMMRSDRGSPVPNEREVAQYDEPSSSEDDDEPSSSEDEVNHIPAPNRIQTFYV